ncbi:MAG: hypothetical protein MZV70_21110 [Desulfobacterales bacterium]|nr:hypothetical protein [Desulfobacterales bacterium]
MTQSQPARELPRTASAEGDGLTPEPIRHREVTTDDHQHPFADPAHQGGQEGAAPFRERLPGRVPDDLRRRDRKDHGERQDHLRFQSVPQRAQARHRHVRRDQQLRLLREGRRRRRLLQGDGVCAGRRAGQRQDLLRGVPGRPLPQFSLPRRKPQVHLQIPAPRPARHLRQDHAPSNPRPTKIP